MNSQSPLTTRLLVGADDTFDDQRKHPRIQSLENAQVRQVRSKHICEALITEVSSSGMRLVVNKAFDKGVMVLIEWSAGFLPCTVRHCTPENGMWVIGVEAELYPSVLALLAALMESAQERNRSLLTSGTGTASPDDATQ